MLLLFQQSGINNFSTVCLNGANLYRFSLIKNFISCSFVLLLNSRMCHFSFVYSQNSSRTIEKNGKCMTQ